MRKIGQVLTVTGTGWMIIGILMILGISGANVLFRIAAGLCGISCCLISVWLILWKKKGFSYRELLPSFHKR